METDLIMVKLVTGEWVIGRDGGDNEERNSFYLDKPYTVMVGTHPDGGWGTALIPYNMTNPNGSIEFSKGAVIAEFDQKPGTSRSIGRNGGNGCP